MFEPLLKAQGSIPSVLRRFLGTMPGSGMVMMFLCTGVMGALTCVIASRTRQVKSLCK
ncbi:MAG: hypothetical protein WCQ66_10890 [Sphaerochaetaceae bacterium]